MSSSYFECFVIIGMCSAVASGCSPEAGWEGEWTGDAQCDGADGDIDVEITLDLEPDGRQRMSGDGEVRIESEGFAGDELTYTYDVTLMTELHDVFDDGRRPVVEFPTRCELDGFGGVMCPASGFGGGFVPSRAGGWTLELNWTSFLGSIVDGGYTCDLELEQ